MNMQELDSEYREKTDSELLRLAMNREQLTPDANVALSGELARRRIDSRTHLEAARLEEQDRLAENEKSIGTLGFFPLFGAGRMRFGRAGRLYDAASNLERFKTTVFIVLFYFPLIPTGTYLVERSRDSPDDLIVLEKLPLDREQILSVWVIAAGSILAFIWLVKLLSSDAIWKLAHRYWR